MNKILSALERISRRGFLKRSAMSVGTLSAAALGWPGARPLRASEPQSILILGAGMAGLAAGRELKAAGHRVQIVEGRQRIGGRVYTSTKLGAPIDMGAAWIHGSESRRHPMAKLAREAGVKTVYTDFAAVRLFLKDGSEYNFDRIESEYDRIATGLYWQATKLNRGSGDKSVGEFIRTAIERSAASARDKQVLHWIFRSSIGTGYGVDLDWLSLRHLTSGEAFGKEDSFFPKGFGELIEHLARGQQIERGCVVRAISIEKQNGKEGVLVNTSRGEFRADRVIVTLPLGVLKADSVQFVPGLSARKREAIRRLGFGSLEKIAMRFSEQFWEDNAFLYGYVAGQTAKNAWAREFCNFAPYVGKPILVGMSGGSAARRLQAKKSPALKDTMRTLRAAAGTRLPNPVATERSGWTDDRFSRGTYTHIAVGSSPADIEALAENIGDRIYFAGEHTNADYVATTHGAYLSGIRAAREII